MKRGATLIVLMGVLWILHPVWARPDVMGFLQKHDAERLQAFVLAENLIDFAARAESARAYLMAAELRLLYPVRREHELPEESIQALIERGKALAPGDNAVQLWATQLLKLAAKSPRGESPLLRFDCRLLPGEVCRRSLSDGSGQRLVMVAQGQGSPLRLSIQDQDGRVLASGTEPWLYFLAEQPVLVELSNAGPVAQDYTLLYR